ncbi:MAG: helical backbone metal receptor [Actinobacteria bacterium]|nr:helical backbone metal receptor [Actinomycetota bacterium]
MKKISAILLITFLIFSLSVVSCTKTKITTAQETGQAAENTETAATESAQEQEVQEELSYPVTVKDDYGRELTLESEPQRIISFAPSTTEILFALGLGDKVVGVSSYDNYPPEVLEKEQIGGVVDLNVEKIISLDPEIAFGIDLSKDKLDQIEKNGIKVFISNPTTLDMALDNIKRIGMLTGKSKEAEKLIAEMQTDIGAISSKVADIPKENRPKVFYEVWNEPLMTAGVDTFIHDMITIAGGINIASIDNLTGWPEYSVERLIEINPDIIIAPKTLAPTPDTITGDKRLSGVKAVLENKVFIVDDDLVTRPGPRVVIGLMDLARAIHPEIFK